MKFYVEVGLTESTHFFKMIHAESIHLEFTPVDPYYVTDTDSAMFKINYALKSIVNQTTFGTGFPSIQRHSPKVRVDTN